MAHAHDLLELARTEEALTVLFCLIDDAYTLLNPNGRRYEPLKRLSDSEVITLALLQQLRGVESERSFLRDTQRFFSHLFPGVVGLHPSSFHRRVRKLRRFLEHLRRETAREDQGPVGLKTSQHSSSPRCEDVHGALRGDGEEEDFGKPRDRKAVSGDVPETHTGFEPDLQTPSRFSGRD